jgi:hypothetical protein
LPFKAAGYLDYQAINSTIFWPRIAFFAQKLMFDKIGSRPILSFAKTRAARFKFYCEKLN